MASPMSRNPIVLRRRCWEMTYSFMGIIQHFLSEEAIVITNGGGEGLVNNSLKIYSSFTLANPEIYLPAVLYSFS
jgi:hypothetical protein